MHRTAYILILTVLITLTASAQEIDTISIDTLPVTSGGKTFKPLTWALRTMDRITEFLQGCDTSYITPQKYEFTTQAELSYFHDYYYMSSNVYKEKKSMSLESGNPMSIGAYIYWGPFGFGHSWNLSDIGESSSNSNNNGYRNVFMLNTARIIAEVYTFRSGKSARFTNITGIKLNGNDDFTGLSSKCVGFNAHYIFNNRKYSWPAAFGENAVQKKAAGTFMAGISYNGMDVNFDRSKLAPHIAAQIDTTLLFNKVNYTDYGISFGYCYNWPFAKNCLLAVSVIPSLGYRKSNVLGESYNYSVLDQVSSDLFFRASLFWNNTKYFSGLVLDLHTYSYREEKFGLTNTYGTLKYILGFNFLKKSKYKTDRQVRK